MTMKTQLVAMRSVVLVALLLMTGAPAFSQQAPIPAVQSAPATARPATEEGTPGPTKPGTEGIRVHGHWKVEVKNPDGSLANRVEFENSLVSPGSGDTLLALFLTGEAAGVDWAIAPNNRGVSQLCSNSNNFTYPCVIVASPSGLYASAACSAVNTKCVPGLVYSYVPAVTTTTPSTSASLQLVGSVVAGDSGSLVNVSTRLAYCAASANVANSLATSPLQCVTPNLTSINNGSVVYTDFTSTTLATPVAFVTGQTITFTVTIAFS